MKKIIVMFSAAMLVLSLCCTACSRAGNEPQLYNSYICDVANDGIVEKTEVSWWNGISKNNPTAEKKKKLTFDGTTYDCTYSRSQCRNYGSFYVDKYEDKNRKTDISVIPGSDDIVGIYRWGLIDECLLQPDVYTTPESALPLAKKIAAQYIDVDAYKIEVKTYDIGVDKPKLTVYCFDFLRCIDGFYTSESLYVDITSKGDLIKLYINNIGLFKDKNISLDKEMLEKSVKAKLEEVYAKNYTYDYTIEKQILTYTPEGNLAVVSQILVSLVDMGETIIELVTVIS